jgi:2-(1,2-epoxy-1,2-dihydrophenyl)acetyl-CoA isomerase
MEEELLLKTDDKGIATLTLNRPQKLNALSVKMVKESLFQVFSEIAANDNVRVLIITGAGDSFCSGVDVKEVFQANASGTSIVHRREFEEPIGACFVPLFELTKPVIAAVNGIAVGAGFALTLLCDFRIASDKARFGTVFLRRGLMPDNGVTFTLPRIVGFSKALELMMSSDIINADEAARIGLVNRMVPHDKLMDETYRFAEKLASGPPIALSFTKRAAYQSFDHSFKEQLAFESWGQNMCNKSEDFKEGVASFLEKRPPQFKGK